MALSDRQKQRVAIASAMAAGKKPLLFDEQTFGLDFFRKREYIFFSRRRRSV